jgi:hypothetical protein
MYRISAWSVEERVVEVEAPPEGAIGHSFLALQTGDHLFLDFGERHDELPGRGTRALSTARASNAGPGSVHRDVRPPAARVRREFLSHDLPNDVQG